jgi:hypothetical protein
MKEAAGCTKDCFLFDAFDYPESVIGVDDLVADLECHISLVAGRVGRTGLLPGTALASIAHLPH